MNRRFALAGALALLGVATAVAVWLRPAAPPWAGPVPDHGKKLEERLAQLGPLTPEGFAARYPTPTDYLTKLSFDPTAAKYFAEFNDPAPKGAKGHIRAFNLNPAELAAFKRNGFVVSERLGGASFSQLLYRVYSRDLPVYISADALLHAWHRSYDAMLEELEETYLSGELTQILGRMAHAVPALHREAGAGPLADAVKDADYFLTVALSLLGRGEKSRLGQDDRVAKTLVACDRLQLERIDLFGRERDTDFSQFKPRGHYERSEPLRRYFRAMMWCGRIDLRVAGNESSPRELGAAVVLHDLLRRGKQFDRWRDFDRVLQAFVGRTDSMTFAQLGDVLKAGGIGGPADVKGLATLEALQKKILDGTIGAQQIQSDYYVASPEGDKFELPRSFTVMGQKFTLDSWVTAQVVFDRIIHDDKKVQRRIPSGLDVAFAALGNNAAVPTLVKRMTDASGREFRDGLPYHRNLAAVRDAIDTQPKETWDESLYAGWLATLRELSRPTTAEALPEAARTEAWAMKGLNTQLASWTQLRHDSILYVKQSYTMTAMCVYPAGFVEPVPAFWARFERMATRAADLVEKMPTAGHPRRPQVEHFRNFAKQLAVLKGIATKQVEQKELTEAETAFLRKVVEQKHRGSGGPSYTGWYFGLFYKGAKDADRWDAIVADVHTDVPAPILGDPGCVLHEGVGGVDFLLVAIDRGKDRMVYGGPVLSHYEFEMPGVARLSDSEWRKRLREGKAPPRPEWTRSYLVPGVNPEAKTYKHEDDK